MPAPTFVADLHRAFVGRRIYKANSNLLSFMCLWTSMLRVGCAHWLSYPLTVEYHIIAVRFGNNFLKLDVISTPVSFFDTYENRIS